MNSMFFRVLGMIGMLAEELATAATDGTLTAAELIRIGEKICEALGIDLDTTGFELPVETPADPADPA